jgi:hypothetical protein
LVVQSPVFNPEIGFLPTGKEVSLSVPLPRLTNIISLGLYEVSKGGKCSFVGSRVAGDRMTFGARRFLPLVMLDDRVPPKASYKGRRTLHHLGNVWVFAVSDVGKGISWLGSTAHVDGKEAETYADPDHREIYVLPPEAKIRKSPQISLIVRDEAGNATPVKVTP